MTLSRKQLTEKMRQLLILDGIEQDHEELARIRDGLPEMPIEGTDNIVKAIEITGDQILEELEKL